MKKVSFLVSILTIIGLFFVAAPKANANTTNTWTKTASNPVVNNPLAAYPRVILDGNTYKIWVEGNDGKIRYGTSADGITWSALQVTVNADANNDVHEASIVKDGATFKMWYAIIGGTGYRTSADGINWSAEQICVFDKLYDWDGDKITPYVIKDGSTFKMYYNANEGNTNFYIAYATSVDGINWAEPTLNLITDTDSGTTNNNLIIKQGTAGAWDGYQAGEALYSNAVLKNDAGTYEMWYGGNSDGVTFSIGYATSTDGIHWTKSTSNPVFRGTAGTWDVAGVYYPNIIQGSDGNYSLFYALGTFGGDVGRATAPKVVLAATPAPVLPDTGANTNFYYFIVIGLILISPAVLIIRRKQNS